MKIEILKEHLEEAVQIVSKVSNKNLSLPVLGCVVLVANATKTVLRATNLDISVEIQLKAKVDTEGSVAVPAALFAQTVQTATDQKINLDTKGNTLVVKGSHGEAKLNTLDVSEFPTLPYVKEGEGVSIHLPSKELVRALKTVSFAASTSGVRPELSSVFLKVSDSSLITAATDSFRLAEMKLPIKTKDDVDPVLIPARNIQDIIRVVEKNDTTELRITENQITCIAGGNYITSRIIDGAFPEYHAIFPKEFVSTSTVLVEDLVRALRKMSVFVDTTGQIEIESSTEKKHSHSPPQTHLLAKHTRN